MGDALTRGTTFSSGQSVTHTDLNNLVDDATIQAYAVQAGNLNATADDGVIAGHPGENTNPDGDDYLLVHADSTNTLGKTSIGALSRFMVDARTVTELNNFDGDYRKEGSVAYCTNGNAGAKCLAVYDGTNWKVVALGSTIATS